MVLTCLGVARGANPYPQRFNYMQDFWVGRFCKAKNIA